MNEWGFNPSTLSAVGSLGVPLAIAGFLFEMRQNNKARNLEAIFHISDAMRQRWEHSWELLSNLVEIPFQANCRSVRRSRHPVDLAML